MQDQSLGGNGQLGAGVFAFDIEITLCGKIIDQELVGQGHVVAVGRQIAWIEGRNDHIAGFESIQNAFFGKKHLGTPLATVGIDTFEQVGGGTDGATVVGTLQESDDIVDGNNGTGVDAIGILDLLQGALAIVQAFAAVDRHQ